MPVLVRVLLFSTVAFGNAQLTVPLTLNDSLFSKPLYAGVPLTVTVVNPSYSLSEADKLVIVSVFVDTVLETVATLTVVAPVLLKAMFPEYVPTAVDAAKRTSIDVDAMAPQASGEIVKLVA